MSDKRGSKADHPVPGILGIPGGSSEPSPVAADSGVAVNKLIDDGAVRTFPSGATRDTETDKLDYEAFLNPLVLQVYAEYMHEHRKRSDGSLRDGDDWQRGMPTEVYMKSLMRHVIDVWLAYRGYGTAGAATYEKLLCAVIFNAMGLLFNSLHGKH